MHILALIAIFCVLVGIGVWQMRISQKEKQKMKAFLSFSQDGSTANQGLEERVLRYRFGSNTVASFKEFIYHFKGDSTQVLMKHLIMLMVINIGALYLNSIMLQMNPLPIVLAASLVASYFIYIGAKKKDRKDFEEAFSEALNIIGSAVGVGNTVISGIEECSRKLADTKLGQVFKRVHQRLEIGEDIEVVLMGTYNDLHYREYYFFVVAVIINMRGGGQLKEIMGRLGKIISDGRIMDKQKYAKTSEARMSVKTLAIMPLLMFVALRFLSPENFNILTETTGGHYILIYCTVSVMLGLAIVWAMMNKV